MGKAASLPALGKLRVFLPLALSPGAARAHSQGEA